MKVSANGRVAKVEIAADGDGLVSRSGTALLAELCDRLGLTDALCEALADTRERAGGHDPGRVLRDIALTLADGGDCISDLGALRDPDLFGSVASNATAWRAIERACGRLDDLRSARARARERAWSVGGAPEEIVLDFDSHLVTSHSEKVGATPTWKRGFGFHPLLCYLDQTGEALAGILREGRAGANDAADHVEVLSQALEQIPEAHLDRPMLARSDSAGATHEFAAALRETAIRFSLGFPITEAVREAILEIPDSGWRPAVDADGEVREGASVTELTSSVCLSPDWPQGTRLICRRERPHPGAQLSFTDSDGHRFQCFITDQNDSDIAGLEARHRAHARVEDRIRCARECGLTNLPFREFRPNEVWLELILAAQDLLAAAATLCLDGDLRRAEPKRLRHRLLHVVGKMTRSGRRTTLHLPRRWPWVEALVAAFERLRRLPAPT
ncbi:MAG: IS1380 family transposase [Actinomycetota bacterium]|nr:IS1380 family transposase [Actinomycetota bacterium]